MVVYSSFFNGTHTLETALAKNAAEIIKLFKAFAANAEAYGVQEEARGSMESAVLMIETVRGRYENIPKQNPGYIEDPTAQLGSLTVGYQGNEFKLRTLYDIVGWIFSVVGDVPNGATGENYYYPLMMIGYVFCTKLISRRKAPEVWSVMWFKQKVNNQSVMRVVLGANLDDPGPSPKDDAKDFRKDLLKKGGILVWGDDTPVPMQTLEPKGTGFKGQDFGHCAESYPLLFICSLAKDRSEAFKIRGSAKGFAALPKSLYTVATSKIEPYSDAEGKVNSKIIPPCGNCACLMGGLGNGFTVARFEEGLTTK